MFKYQAKLRTVIFNNFYFFFIGSYNNLYNYDRNPCIQISSHILEYIIPIYTWHTHYNRYK